MSDGARKLSLRGDDMSETPPPPTTPLVMMTRYECSKGNRLFHHVLPPPTSYPIVASYDRYRVMRAVFTFPRATMWCLLFGERKKKGLGEKEKNPLGFPLAIWPRRAHTVTGPLTCFQWRGDGARRTAARRDVRFGPRRRKGGVAAGK